MRRRVKMKFFFQHGQKIIEDITPEKIIFL